MAFPDDVSVYRSEVYERILAEQAGTETASDEDMLGWLTDAGWRGDVAGVVIALYQSVRAGVRADVTGDVEAVLGRAPKSFADFAREQVGSWS